MEIWVTRDEWDKAKQMLDDFWDPRKKVHSFKACYVAITGDTLVSGRYQNAPKFLIVPVDLDKAGYDLITPASFQEGVVIAGVDYQKTWQLQLIVVVGWNDTNNWYLAADPKDCPGIEIGFIDGNEEPELFVQDMPNVGSMFSNDKLTYKIRHEYGGAVCDYRAFDGSIVG